MKIKPLILIMILMVEIIILSGCGTGQKEITLAYKFPLDKKFHYRYEGKTSSTIYENGKLVDSGEKDQRISYTRESVEAIDDNQSKVRFDYISYNGTDSSAWNSEFVMAPNGKIVDILPVDSTTQLSVAYYKKLFEQTSPMYPSEPVPVGYTWNHTVKAVLNDGVTDASTTYKIKSIVREAGFDCAVIEYKGTMFLPLAENISGDPKIKVNGSDRIDVEGVVYFAYTLGAIVREEETSHLVREGSLIRDKNNVKFQINEIRNFTSRLIRVEDL